ncbi:hypothetical protein GWI34_42220, partial [Actinomadura sp. DSM 109109]|nr:hypothetical protein [Actinomadura lepetitiana]
MHAQDGANFTWSGNDEWIGQYYRHTSEEELQGYSQEELEKLAGAHRKLASRRAPGEALVDVMEDGSQSILLIATDDMSFLVSSITAEIAAKYGGISSLNHPIFIVERTVDGELVSIQPTGVEQPVASGDTAALPSLRIS